MTAEPSGREGLVLLADDDASTRKVARANLGLEGFEVIVASCGAEALARLADSDPLAMVSDLKMPDVDGIALMERVHALRPSLPVVLVTAHATVETAVQAMRKGALHYLTKPVRWDELALVLRHAVAHERQRRDVERLTGELERAAGFEEMVGTSAPVREVLSLVEQVAGADATVLLRGETGTGKELVARALHRRSPRRDRPFVAVNCAAIPRELMESEFFGHEKGAFTGAVARRRGALRAGRRRDALPRRGGGSRPRHPGEAPAGAAGAGDHPRRRAGRRAGGRADRRRHEPRPRGRS